MIPVYVQARVPINCHTNGVGDHVVIGDGDIVDVKLFVENLKKSPLIKPDSVQVTLTEVTWLQDISHALKVSHTNDSERKGMTSFEVIGPGPNNYGRGN